MQNPFSPHKTYCSHGALYLNVSEAPFHFAQSIPGSENFVLNKRILGKINYYKMLFYLHFYENSSGLWEKCLQPN
jgi:hypothetical protein